MPSFRSFCMGPHPELALQSQAQKVKPSRQTTHLTLLAQLTVLMSEPPQLLALGARQPIGAAALIPIGRKYPSLTCRSLRTNSICKR